MTTNEYEDRQNEINAWIKAQYDQGKHSEQWIELRAELMFDKLDRQYLNGRTKNGGETLSCSSTVCY